MKSHEPQCVRGSVLYGIRKQTLSININLLIHSMSMNADGGGVLCCVLFVATIAGIAGIAANTYSGRRRLRRCHRHHRRLHKKCLIQ